MSRVTVVKPVYPPPQWVNRSQEPNQKIDQCDIAKYYQRLNRMTEKGSISPYEHILAIKLKCLGYASEPQYAVPDMNAGDIFYWYYDLYVPKLDMLIEVQGRNHKDKDQIVKDVRKKNLARIQGFKFKEITNIQVNNMDRVKSLVTDF